MAETRGWKVRSNSFRPDYEIRGTSVADAIQSEFRRIAQDALPRSGGWRPTSARAQWTPGILRGIGGVELVIEAVPSDGGPAASYPVWIAAAASELPEPLRLQPAAARA